MEKVLLSVQQINTFRKMGLNREPVTLEGVNEKGKMFSVTGLIALVSDSHLLLNFGSMMGKYHFGFQSHQLTVLQMKDRFNEVIYVNPFARMIKEKADNELMQSNLNNTGFVRECKSYPNQEQNLSVIRRSLGKPVNVETKAGEMTVLAMDYYNSWKEETTTLYYQTNLGYGNTTLGGNDKVTAVSYEQFFKENVQVLN